MEFGWYHSVLKWYYFLAREKNDKKLFGFSFARLMDKDGATIQDGQHELYIYKCEDPAKLDSCSYLLHPCSAKDTAVSQECAPIPSFSRSHREVVYVRTLLCSTKLTQNGKNLKFIID